VVAIDLATAITWTMLGGDKAVVDAILPGLMVEAGRNRGQKEEDK